MGGKRKHGAHMPLLNVSDEALLAEKKLYYQVAELQKAIESSTHLIISEYQENEQGLGAHSRIIDGLLQELHSAANSRTSVNQLRRVLRFSIANRENHRNNVFLSQNQRITPATDNVAYTAGVIGRIYEEGYRQLRTQSKDGYWDGDIFFPDREAIPIRYNPNKRTYGQIFDNLKTQYGISYSGIPYREGYADFSGIAIAQVSLADIVDKHVQDGLIDDPLVAGDSTDFAKIFSNREQNFQYADEIVANAQVSIPSLPSGYSSTDLAKWREEHHFTWDESYLNGYLLVPSEIHNNISHTGLVGVSKHGKQAEETITGKLKNRD